jgi:hypothetical protein
MRREVPAILSASLLIAILVVSAFSLYGKIDYSPIFINGNFNYWTQDARHGGIKPYFWHIDQFQSENDSIHLYPGEVDGRYCLTISLSQDGEDNVDPWVSIHIRQEIGGQELHTLFNSRIGIWVYANFSYTYDEVSMKPKNAFGIEVNDGENLLWILFSDTEEYSYTLPHHRIVILQTSLGEWVYHEVDVAAEYRELVDDQPDSISIILLMGISKDLPGTYQGSFSNITTINR